ncbi:MAG: hypothetical protein R3338_05560 [Thermoanaerobaculia bacterium]|nr:hypothetical protein [Thermoanaerobaculia bacterium]
MKCEDLRTMLRSGQESPELQEHLRACAECLELAVSIEPASMFATLGGEEVVPPGGVDLFVSDVMNEIRLRETEKSLDAGDHPVRVAWWWSAAAAIFILLTTWLAVQSYDRPDVTSPNAPAAVAEDRTISEPERVEPSVTRPVIDDYERAEAMIVELPSESTDDLKIVMIFDENLPQDL